MSGLASRDAAYFNRLYRDDPDPWKFASSDYERGKYAATLQAVSGRRFTNALEVGCSIGVLTYSLAAQCDSLLGIDISEAPLRHARALCRRQRQVRFRRLAVPGQWPEGSFELIVLSEVLYFLAPAENTTLARLTLVSLALSGRVLLVNWLGPTNAPCGGDEAARIFIAACEALLRITVARQTSEYRLDLLVLDPQ